MKKWQRLEHRWETRENKQRDFLTHHKEKENSEAIAAAAKERQKDAAAFWPVF